MATQRNLKVFDQNGDECSHNIEEAGAENDWEGIHDGFFDAKAKEADEIEDYEKKVRRDDDWSVVEEDFV